MKKKNLLLDLNLLLNAYLDKSYKTGLYYQEYNILKVLVEKYADKFNFYAFCKCSKSFYNKKLKKEYKELENVEFCRIYSHSEYFCKILNSKIKPLRKSKNKLKLIKILFLKLIKFIIMRIITTKPKLKNIDLYQTFYEPIPKNIQKKQHIKKFIFINDLIPYTNPEYFKKDKKEQKKLVIKIQKQIENIDQNTIIFTNSDFTKNELLKNFPKFKENVIFVCKLAASDNFYKIENINKEDSDKILEYYKIPTNEKYILSLSSLNKRKNLDFLIESFIDFLDKNPNIKDLNLVLAGPSGWLMDEMLNSIKKAHKYKNKIILTGFVDDKDVNIIYNRALIFTFPSLFEGFGLPVLEAMKTGTPIISSNLTSLPEVYNNSAMEINPKNKKELISAFQKMYFDSKLRIEYANKGLNESKKFSWEKTVDIMIKEYINY